MPHTNNGNVHVRAHTWLRTAKQSLLHASLADVSLVSALCHCDWWPPTKLAQARQSTSAYLHIPICVQVQVCMCLYVCVHVLLYSLSACLLSRAAEQVHFYVAYAGIDAFMRECVCVCVCWQARVNWLYNAFSRFPVSLSGDLVFIRLQVYCSNFIYSRKINL